jgi:hypothetical protein
MLVLLLLLLLLLLAEPTQNCWQRFCLLLWALQWRGTSPLLGRAQLRG